MKVKTAEKENKTKEDIHNLDSSQSEVREMISAGLIYGHKKSRTNPRFKKHIYTTRNGIEIIDVAQTLPALDSAISFMKEIVKKGGLVLIVAVQPAAKQAVEDLAKKFKFAYINEKWVGGLLTNFKIISKRIEYFNKIEKDFEKGEFEKYTKKERLLINKRIERMRRLFTGLEELNKMPDAIFVIDPSKKSHKTAINEALRKNIPIVAIIDSDDNPDLINYPIPANDHAKTSIDWIINRIIKNL